jgi:hypothetical protein
MCLRVYEEFIQLMAKCIDNLTKVTQKCGFVHYALHTGAGRAQINPTSTKKDMLTCCPEPHSHGMKPLNNTKMRAFGKKLL